MSSRKTSKSTTLISLFTCFIILFSAAVFFAFHSTKNAALNFYESLATRQIENIEDILRDMLNYGAVRTEYLANLDLTRNSRGRLTSYLDTAEGATLLYGDYTPYEKGVYREFFQVVQAKGNYTSVSMGNDDGQFIQAPDMYNLPPGYDPRLSPWYREAVSGDRGVIVTSPYKTVADGAEFSVVTRTYDLEGMPLGVLGIHYKLDHLTWDLIKRGISKTGYIVLFAADGRIISDGRHPQYAMMEADAGRIAMAPDGPSYVEAGSDEGAKYVVTLTEPRTGWKIAVVFDLNYVMESPYSMLRIILLTSAFIFTIVLSAAACYNLHSR